MLRAILVGLLSLSAVNCKSHDATVKSQPGVAAGSVIQVAGTVTLHHGDAARPLAKGDTVEGDDIVETGADGSVTIELAHNNATWELGANKKSKVRESLAWTAPKKETSAKAVEEDSAAAGRHAERSAADTSVSSGAGAKEAVPTPQAAAPPADLERDDDGVATDEKKKPEVQKLPPAKTATASKGGRASAAQDKGDIGTATASVTAKDVTPPKTAIIAKQLPQAPPNVQAVQSESMPAPPPGGPAASGPADGGGGGGGGASPQTAALDLLQTKHDELLACLGSKTATLHVVIKIDAKGKATAVFDAGTKAAVKTCVTNVVTKLEFAASAVSATLQIKP